MPMINPRQHRNARNGNRQDYESHTDIYMHIAVLIWGERIAICITHTHIGHSEWGTLIVRRTTRLSAHTFRPQQNNISDSTHKFIIHYNVSMFNKYLWDILMTNDISIVTAHEWPGKTRVLCCEFFSFCHTRSVLCAFRNVCMRARAALCVCVYLQKLQSSISCAYNSHRHVIPGHNLIHFFSSA